MPRFAVVASAATTLLLLVTIVTTAVEANDAPLDELLRAAAAAASTSTTTRTAAKKGATAQYGFIRVPTQPNACTTTQPRATWSLALPIPAPAGSCVSMGQSASYRFTCSKKLQKVDIFADASCAAAQPTKTITSKQCGEFFGVNATASCLPASSLVRMELSGSPTCGAGPSEPLPPTMFVLPKDECVLASPSSSTAVWSVVTANLVVGGKASNAAITTYSLVYSSTQPAKTCTPTNILASAEGIIALFGQPNVCQKLMGPGSNVFFRFSEL